MATEYFFFKGKTKWFRPDTPNQWGKWAHVLYPDNESLEKIRELQAQGVKNTIKKDEDGYFVSISRPIERTANTPGGRKMVGMTPPEVIGTDGLPLKGILVGNGSDVTTKVEVYAHATPSGGKAKAMRWLASRIDNLIPYEKKDFTDGEKHQVKDLAEQSEPLF